MSNVISGVPQGSVLDPIVFIIYANDLKDVLSNKATFKLFADDLKLYSSFNIPSFYVNLQLALDLLVLWSTSWQLPINQSKTQLLHLGLSQNVHSYHIDGNNIMSTNKVLDLGVTTDSDLRYASHISSIVSKARSRSSIIFRNIHFHNTSLLSQAFISFVRPILENASQIWNSSILKYTTDLENVQRNFTYRIRSIKHLSYPERLAILNLEPLELRRLKTDILMYYKILNNLIPISPDEH